MKLKTGNYFLTKKPYMEGYTLLEHELRTIPIKIENGMVIGKNKHTGEMQSFPLQELDQSKCYIDKSEEKVIKMKLRELTVLRNNLHSYFDTVLNDMETLLKDTNYYEKVESYPEVLI